MAECSVTIPPSGKPVIHRDPRAVVVEEYVNWKFHNENPKVDWVRVIFKNSTAKIFPVAGSYKHYYDKKYRDGMTIWGRPGSINVDVAREDYSIEAWSEKPPPPGQTSETAVKVSEKDPQLIINRP